jgi:DNA-binding MarR family transcriptional regulator
LNYFRFPDNPEVNDEMGIKEEQSGSIIRLAKVGVDISFGTYQYIVRQLTNWGRMADKRENLKHDSVGAWAKRLYFASRAVMDSVLRPYDLGSTQWYVLYQLANEGPTMQRDLVRMLQIERATLSGIVATLVRKGLVDQASDSVDQRQRMLRITRSGTKLWKELPDPINLILTVAFDGADPAELAIARRVLQAATQRLNEHISGGNQA